MFVSHVPICARCFSVTTSFFLASYNAYGEYKYCLSPLINPDLRELKFLSDVDQMAAHYLKTVLVLINFIGQFFYLLSLLVDFLLQFFVCVVRNWKGQILKVSV